MRHCVLCLAGMLMPLCAAAVWPQAAYISAAAKRKELQEVQQQLEQKKREIEQYRRQTDVLKRDLSHLAGEKSVWRAKIRKLEQKIVQAEGKKAELKAKIGALELAEDRWHGVLARETNGYLSQDLTAFPYYGNEDLWEEPLRRAAILEKVRYVRDLSGFKRDVQQAAAEENRKKIQLQAQTAEAEAERRHRESLYRSKEEAYLETRQKVKKTQQDVQDLQDSAAALTQLVRALERKSRRKSRLPVPAVLAQPPHSLPWPAKGRVIDPFGRQYVPELHTWVIHQGIRLATAADAPIHPVESGKVIFAGPFRSYGQVIIVDHGQAFYTIYGKLGQMLKRPGDRVNPSDALGTAGTAGAKGTLYFEMRQSAAALDPLVWLTRR